MGASQAPFQGPRGEPANPISYEPSLSHERTIPELTKADFADAIPRRQRERLMRGDSREGDDVVALRRFTRLTQQAFSAALGISVHTLGNWEQGRRRPEVPALALLRIAARHPRVLQENLAASA